jgi:hypothetical protein
MIDNFHRKSLSQDVRRLVTGRMTNDEFDVVYFEQYESSDDLAVREIAGMCYGLYSSDVLIAYRLRGRHAVDAETRRTAARAVLFLRSGREYNWPQWPDDPGLRLLAGLATFLGVPLGVVLLMAGGMLALGGPAADAVIVAICGLLILAASLGLALNWQKLFEPNMVRFRSAGDFDVWPFLKREEFDNARQTCHLLGSKRG